MRAAVWPVALVLVPLVATTACSGGRGGINGSSGTTAPPSPSASISTDPADRFLSTYVTSDGRVLRHDQGNDIVSEGQAYGMLIAELAGRNDVARSIWSWTQQHLADATGLLAYHASATGTVLDHQPAADADTLAAFALLRYAGPGATSLHRDGRRLAAAVLAYETVPGPSGDPVLVAGPWARADGVVDPSYWMPGVFQSLARLTGDRRWATMSATTVDLVHQVTDGGRRLPPDWATIHGTRIVPSGQGGGSGQPQYGPDAQRVPLWFAASCDPAATHLAAMWWRLLQTQNRSSATSLTLDGNLIDGAGSSVALLAAAATAHAGGDSSGAHDLQQGAEQVDQGTPTYYGGAWLALAPGLTSGQLIAC